MGWQRPTLPHRHRCSTIGANGLNLRVRDGSEWTPVAKVTNNPLTSLTHSLVCLHILFSINNFFRRFSSLFCKKALTQKTLEYKSFGSAFTKAEKSLHILAS